MLLNIGDRASHPGNQLPETQLRVEGDTYYHRVGKKTDQRFQLWVVTVSDRATHRQIILAAVSAK